MIAAVREWLAALLAAAILLAAAQMLMPQGNVRRVGSLLCGLLFILAALRGAVRIDLAAFTLDVEAYEAELLERRESLEREQEAQRAAIIENRTATYISDKASSMGLTLGVSVETETDADGIVLPVRVILAGAYSEAFSRWLSTEMGFPPERQVWNEA
ncbi:MAG: stage III sporulation protein AF [Oscillibacter sp.]|nr:stage III sporulation protein AF [Oscillibacter sp.]